MSKAAIIGFGMHIPNKRISTEEIARNNHANPDTIRSGLGIEQKSIPDKGDDAFTLAYEAGLQAIDTAQIQSSQISALYVGSESHPYAVKPTSSMVADALQVDPFCFAADVEFACKAGTACMQIVSALVQSKQVRYGLAIGSDTAQSKPGDALEYSAAAGAAAMLLGPDKDKNALCRIEHTLSFTTDTPDFWRANGEEHPAHAGRFTGEPGYFHHVRTTFEALLETTKADLTEIDHAILHMPNAKFPMKIAKEFGITQEQLEHGFIVPEIGNTYSACSMIGLAHVLQKAKKDETIAMVSYGSGAGCDAFLMTMLKDGIALPQSNDIEHVSYAEYQQLTTMQH